MGNFQELSDLKKTINPPPLYFDTDLLTKLIDFKEEE